ncbi:Phosphotriesterase [Luteitalea pratensis]|uniref:Phosphotriesterase n=2 Tax=Luteitalea pratensis TaxID=1855912 RepID=A0A143PWG5_LUTPR|nr:Phosphotriesterase [Luteitalea pratensis]
MHDRREFLGSLAALGVVPLTLLAQDGRVATVTGEVAVRDLGMVLMHEHLMVDFIGAGKVSRSRYDADEVVRVALPHLKEAHDLGCRTLVECTPAFLGRNAALLQRLSQASGLRIIANTGYYGAARDKHLPAHAFKESARDLAQRWINEQRRGIDGTDILPGIMKIGVDPGGLSDIDRKLVEAAAIAHRATGLPIASHTVDGTAAHQSLDVLDAQGVAAGAFIWVHAHNEGDDASLKRAAERGAWVEFDGIGPDSVDRHVQLVKMMADAGHLGRVLVSHDAGWYHVGEEGGGTFRPFDTVFRRFVPAIRAALNEAAVTQLLVTNPAQALARRA